MPWIASYYLPDCYCRRSLLMDAEKRTQLLLCLGLPVSFVDGLVLRRTV